MNTQYDNLNDKCFVESEYRLVHMNDKQPDVTFKYDDILYITDNKTCQIQINNNEIFNEKFVLQEISTCGKKVHQYPSAFVDELFVKNHQSISVKNIKYKTNDEISNYRFSVVVEELGNSENKVDDTTKIQIKTKTADFIFDSMTEFDIPIVTPDKMFSTFIYHLFVEPLHGNFKRTEIKSFEMKNSFLVEIESLNWQLIEVNDDGNGLYRCFAISIYNDTDKHMLVRADCCKYMRENHVFFRNFIHNFEQRMNEKEQEHERGDQMDIIALSELYNVRVKVFEYDKSKKKLYLSFYQGEHLETKSLPLILLAKHRKKHYNIITDPQAMHKRPLNTAEYRTQNISLKELRLKRYVIHMTIEQANNLKIQE
eukprot:486400_1